MYTSNNNYELSSHSSFSVQPPSTWIMDQPCHISSSKLIFFSSKMSLKYIALSLVSSSPVDSVGIDVTESHEDHNNNHGSDMEEEGDSLNMSRSSKRG